MINYYEPPLFHNKQIREEVKPFCRVSAMRFILPSRTGDNVQAHFTLSLVQNTAEGKIEHSRYQKNSAGEVSPAPWFIEIQVVCKSPLEGTPALSAFLSEAIARAVLLLRSSAAPSQQCPAHPVAHGHPAARPVSRAICLSNPLRSVNGCASRSATVDTTR